MAIYFYNQYYDLLNGFSANAIEVDGKLWMKLRAEQNG
jgi:hypothetical protein